MCMKRRMGIWRLRRWAYNTFHCIKYMYSLCMFSLCMYSLCTIQTYQTAPSAPFFATACSNPSFCQSPKWSPWIKVFFYTFQTFWKVGLSIRKKEKKREKKKKKGKKRKKRKKKKKKSPTQTNSGNLQKRIYWLYLEMMWYRQTADDKFK